MTQFPCCTTSIIGGLIEPIRCLNDRQNQYLNLLAALTKGQMDMNRTRGNGQEVDIIVAAKMHENEVPYTMF